MFDGRISLAQMRDEKGQDGERRSVVLRGDEVELAAQ